MESRQPLGFFLPRPRSKRDFCQSLITSLCLNRSLSLFFAETLLLATTLKFSYNTVPLPTRNTTPLRDGLLIALHPWVINGIVHSLPEGKMIAIIPQGFFTWPQQLQRVCPCGKADPHRWNGKDGKDTLLLLWAPWVWKTLCSKAMACHKSGKHFANLNRLSSAVHSHPLTQSMKQAFCRR